MTAESLFQRILREPDVFYRHQQNDEPDLSEEDKRAILSDLLISNKVLFLQRYRSSQCSHKFLKRSDAQNVGHVLVHTYFPFQLKTQKGKYFSDEKMREREPYLYDVMVGKFVQEKDRINLRPSVSREECVEGGWANMMCQFESSREIAQRRNEHHTEWQRDAEVGISGSIRLIVLVKSEEVPRNRRRTFFYLDEVFINETKQPVFTTG
uniref:DUF2052 domain-containing protein n=1 Tax=Angiostrongylus cantonensis TaxID=6313 RepID=A0A0K0CU05_ANGCA